MMRYCVVIQTKTLYYVFSIQKIHILYKCTFAYITFIHILYFLSQEPLFVCSMWNITGKYNAGL